MAKADNHTWRRLSWPDTPTWDTQLPVPTRFGFKTEQAYTLAALDNAHRAALHIPEFNLKHDRYIILSDTHKGDRARGSDEFQDNDVLYCHTLEHYLNGDYRLVLNGDSEEGWKARYEAIVDAYDDTAFAKEREFARRGPGYYLRTWGNHDMDWRNPALVRRYLWPALRRPVRVYSAIVLGGKIMIAHGHQGDFNSDRLAWLSRRIVRYLWKPVQRMLDVAPHRNTGHHNRVHKRDKYLSAWSHLRRMLLIAGHTHNPVMGALNTLRRDDDPKAHYINDGCCVYDGSLTGIELDQGEIRLVKWESSGKPATFLRTILQRADLGAVLGRLGR